jgi:hypothetical protein
MIDLGETRIRNFHYILLTLVLQTYIASAQIEMPLKSWLKSPAQSDGHVTKNKEDLLEAFPQSTEAERSRFLKARENDYDAASMMYLNYLKWRNQNFLSSDLNQCMKDSEDEDSQWNSCVLSATTLCGEDNKAIILPRLVRFNCHDDPSRQVVDLEGRRVLQFFPGLCNFKNASEETYCMAIALFLEKQFDRSNMEKINLMIDVRAGQGWANLSPRQLIPFIRNVSRILQDNFPERLARCIVFPVPYAATVFWKIIKPFLDGDTSEKIQLLSGPAAIKSPIPSSMAKFMDEKELKCMEKNRESTFIT